MLDKIRSVFNKGEESRRMALKPDEPKQPRNLKDPKLGTWMEEAGEAGENSDQVTEFSPADLSKVTVPEGRPHLEVVVDEDDSEAETDQADPVRLESVRAENINTEAVDAKETELEQRLQRAEAQVRAAMAEIAAVRKEMNAYQSARERVEKAA